MSFWKILGLRITHDFPPKPRLQRHLCLREGPVCDTLALSHVSQPGAFSGNCFTTVFQCPEVLESRSASLCYQLT